MIGGLQCSRLLGLLDNLRRQVAQFERADAAAEGPDMSRKLQVAVIAAITLLASPAWAVSYGSYGGAVYQGSSVELTSDNGGGPAYSGIYMEFDGSLDLSAITQLSADYSMLVGAFGGGAPRFSIVDTTNNSNNEIYAYWGTPGGGGAFTNPNAENTAGSTGNYADLLSSDLRFQINGFGGDNINSNTYLTWAQVVAAVGDVPVGFVTIDLDGGFTGNQQLLVTNFTVNNNAFQTPLPTSLVLFLGAIGLLVLVGRGTGKADRAAV